MLQEQNLSNLLLFPCHNTSGIMEILCDFSVTDTVGAEAVKRNLSSQFGGSVLDTQNANAEERNVSCQLSGKFDS